MIIAYFSFNILFFVSNAVATALNKMGGEFPGLLNENLDQLSHLEDYIVAFVKNAGQFTIKGEEFRLYIKRRFPQFINDIVIS